MDEKKLEELVSNMDDRIRMHDYSKEQLLLLIEEMCIRDRSQLGLPLVPDTSYYYPRFYLGLSEGEKRESGEIPSCDMCFDGRYYAVSGFITGAIGAKFPGMNHLVEGVVDTTVSAGERLARCV